MYLLAKGSRQAVIFTGKTFDNLFHDQLFYPWDYRRLGFTKHPFPSVSWPTTYVFFACRLNFYTLHIIFTGVSWPVWLLHKNFCHFEPLSEGANSILEKFPSLLQCFGPDLIPPLTSLRSVKGDTRRTGNADEDVETKRELLGKKVNKERPQ